MNSSTNGTGPDSCAIKNLMRAYAISRPEATKLYATWKRLEARRRTGEPRTNADVRDLAMLLPYAAQMLPA